MTLTEAKQQFLEYLEIEKGRSVLTVRNYDHYLSRFFTWLESDAPEAITEQKVREFRLWLNRQRGSTKHGHSADTMKKKTQNYHLIALRTFLKFLHRRGVETLNPNAIELAKVPDRSLDLITPDDLERLREAPDTSTPRGRRDKAIIELLFSTGLRVSELCGLDRDSFDLARNEFSVRGKGEKVRLVFLSPSAKNALHAYLDKRDDADMALFVQYGTRAPRQVSNLRLTPRSVQRIMQHYAAKAGITRILTPHVLRHSFATDLLRNGADVRVVQEMLGHASITTTQVYTHVTDSHLREAFEKYHDRD